MSEPEEARPDDVEIGALLGSGDLAIAVIVVQRGLVTPDVLDRHVEAFVARGAGRGAASLLSHLVDKGVVSPGDVPAIKQARAATGCVCAACDHVTYLLAGQTNDATPCERCKKQGTLGPPGAQPARRSSAVHSALPPSLRRSSAVQAALPPPTPAPIGTPVGPDPASSGPPAGGQDRRHVQILAGISAIALLCFVAPCLFFLLAPPPDWSDYQREPRAGQFRASIYSTSGLETEGLVVELGPRDPAERQAVRFDGSNDRRRALLPYRLWLTNGQAVDDRVALILRDRKGAAPALQTITDLVAAEGGAPLHPWLLEAEVTPPRKVVVRVVVRTVRGVSDERLLPLPKLTSLELDE